MQLPQETPATRQEGSDKPARQREFPSLTSVQLRHVSGRSWDIAGPQPRLKLGWRPERPKTGGNTLLWGWDCISKWWQELCRWKAWPPCTAAMWHVWHSGENHATNTHGVIVLLGIRSRLGTATPMITSLWMKVCPISAVQWGGWQDQE